MKKRIALILLLIFTAFVPYSIIEMEAQETEIQQIFSINLLSPLGDASSNQITLLIENQLPKFGIGVDFLESTTMDNIAPRTWEYPLIDFDYIPTYAEGGYDILFNSHIWDFDWDPTLYFDIEGQIPSGKNFYQYYNPTFDTILYEYRTEMNSSTRIEYAHDLQAILYEDLPSICIVYPRLLYAFRDDVIGVDSLLLSLSQFRSEHWDDLSDHVINYTIPEKMNAPNNFKRCSYFDNQWMNAVYGSLLQRKQNTHEWEPAIALNYSLSTDGKNYTVHLDPNAKFNDGSPVLAEDVKYTYDLHMTPEVNSRKFDLLTKWFDSNESIEIVDSHTLNFNMSEFWVFSQKLLSIGIIDKSSVEPVISSYGYSIFNEIPLTGNVQDVLVKSCGPFKLDKYNNAEVNLVRNQYWSDLNCSNAIDPFLDKLNLFFSSSKDQAIAALINGSADILDANFRYVKATFEDIGPLYGELVKTLQYQELAINMKHPVFGTGELTPVGSSQAAKAIRKAISHAIPRQVIVDQIYEGIAAEGILPMPDKCYGFDTTFEPYAYDLDLAIQYMDEAGFSYFDPYLYRVGGKLINQANMEIFIVTLLALIGLVSITPLIILKLRRMH